MGMEGTQWFDPMERRRKKQLILKESKATQSLLLLNLITQNAESISAAHAGIVRPADVLGMNGQFHT